MASLALLLAGAILGCVSDTRPKVLSSSEASPGFPTHSTAARVRVQASFDRAHSDRLGTDVVSSGLLPIAVRLSQVGTDKLSLAPGSFHPRLYLQDGTVLRAADARRIKSRPARRALPLGALPAGDAPLEGFLFFELGDDLKVRDHYALNTSGQSYHEVDLEKSLLAFHVETSSGREEVRVGVRSGASE